MLFKETVTLDISQMESEMKRLSEVVERQGEEIIALREENKLLRAICTAHAMSENSAVLCNKNSCVETNASSQNGQAKRKNNNILNRSRSMFGKYLCSTEK